jgi:hypothetical protein
MRLKCDEKRALDRLDPAGMRPDPDGFPRARATL